MAPDPTDSFLIPTYPACGKSQNPKIRISEVTASIGQDSDLARIVVVFERSLMSCLCHGLVVNQSMRSGRSACLVQLHRVLLFET